MAPVFTQETPIFDDREIVQPAVEQTVAGKVLTQRRIRRLRLRGLGTRSLRGPADAGESEQNDYTC
jgi:hypothetical protein